MQDSKTIIDNNNDLTLLHLAAQNNNLEELKNALKQKMDVNAVTKDGWSALHFAAYKGYIEIVNELLAFGADVNICGKVYGRTALHYAAQKGNLAVVKAILAKNPNINIADINGKTARDVAAEASFVEIAEIISKNV